MARARATHGAERPPPLVTQLTVPAPPFGMVERPRLLAALERGLAEPVTLVCAPPGSGKTALVAAGARGAADRVAWVSLEPADDDPGRLWDAGLEALRLAGAVPPGSALASLAAPVPESRAAFMPRFVNALAELPARVVLVLDDVHILRSRECLAQLSFLVLHAPDTLRLVLVTRVDPPVPLHVLRLSGRLAEIRTGDLAFTVQETAELLLAHGLALDDPLVRALHARTEGWAAGLRLAALSVQGREAPERFLAEFAGDDRVVADYLMAEVLQRQPPRRRAFLLRTSLVDQVCGDLADALTGEGHGADTLAELERTMGFLVPADGRREWFRYHRLFGQLLRLRAERELGGELPALHARAARWYAERGAGAEALRHAVDAGEWDLSLELFADHWFDLYVRGDGRAVRALAGRIPAERLEADAEVSAALACTALELGDTEAADRHGAHAQAAARGPRRTRRYLETMALARLAAARLQGDVEAAPAAAGDLLAEAAAQAAPPDAAREAVVRRMLGETALWANQLDRGRAELQRALTLARVADLDFIVVAALSGLALIDVMEGGPAADPSHAHEAIGLAERRGWPGVPQVACAHAALAMAAFHDLRTDAAVAHLERACAAAAQARRRDIDFVLAHLGARIRGAVGAPREGLRLLDEFDAVHRHGTPLPHEEPVLAGLRARLLVATGDLDAAEAVLAPVRTTRRAVVRHAEALVRVARGDPAAAAELLVATGGHARVPGENAVERAVLEAVAREEAGDAEGATRALERALAQAEATRHRRPFVEMGRRMEGMLRRHVRDGTAHPAAAAELLDAFAEREPAPRTAAPLLESLSEREAAILRYLPTPLSNREIAAELFVTTNTVKTHLRSIYRKLDVARRRDAVERARDLRLLTHSRG